MDHRQDPQGEFGESRRCLKPFHRPTTTGPYQAPFSFGADPSTGRGFGAWCVVRNWFQFYLLKPLIILFGGKRKIIYSSHMSYFSFIFTHLSIKIKYMYIKQRLRMVRNVVRNVKWCAIIAHHPYQNGGSSNPTGVSAPRLTISTASWCANLPARNQM